MSNPSSEQALNAKRSLDNVSMGRRSFLSNLAAAGLGAAAATILPASAVADSSAPGASEQDTLLCSDETTVVETVSGKVRGYFRKGVFIFKGMPYGASTARSGRFMPPAKPEPWTGIRNALQYGRTCPSHDSVHTVMDGKNSAASDEDQFVLHRGSSDKVPGEDCLRVNVWTPQINATSHRPVLVFMHGGGYSAGCGHDLLSYDGESLARNHDAVVVNHNHRLNVYGFLNLAGVGGERYGASANVGMLDMVAVLEWVRDNIAAFGGNPGNVTIFGQSGGGGKVIALMAMPAAKGLFHRAAVQSGPFLRALDPEYSTRLASAVLGKLGISNSRIDAIHDVPCDRLSWAAQEALVSVASEPTSLLRQAFGETDWGPTVDGHILPIHPFDPGAPAISANIPFLTGTNLNEFVSGLDQPNPQSMSEAELVRQVSAGFGAKAGAIIAAYRLEYPGSSPFDIFAAIAAAPFRLPSIAQATRKAALGGAPTYAYLYSWRTPVLDGRLGPFHASEISFVMDNAELCDHYSAGSASALTLSKQMGTAWVNFARSGNPNHAGLPFWPAYSPQMRATMVFDTPCTVRNAPEVDGLKLIAEA